MTTGYRRPDWDDVGTFTPSTGAWWYACIDEDPASDTDYVYASTQSSTIVVYVTLVGSIPTGSTSINVKGYCRAKTTGGGWKTGVVINIGGRRATSGGTKYGYVANSLTGATNGQSMTTSYVNFTTQNFTLNPKTSAAWTVDDVNGVEGSNHIGGMGSNIWLLSKGTGQVNISQMYIEITYTPPAATTPEVIGRWAGGGSSTRRR